MAGKISVDDVIIIHETLTDHFANAEDPVSPAGIKNKALLESAVARPFQTAGRKPAYNTPHKRAAVLFHAIINNHPFHNGNKRTALIAAQVLLARDNFWLDNTYDEELFEFTRKTAAHELSDSRADEVNDIAEWFEAKTRRVKAGEHPLTYRALKEILENFGFSIIARGGELLDIDNSRGERITRIIKGGFQGFAPYDVDYINGLRKRLKLTKDDGYDSRRFYGDKSVGDIASELIDLRIEVMQRLART